MKLLVPCMSIVVLLFLSGCVPKAWQMVEVDAIGMNKDINTSYILLSGNKDVSVDDLQFKEYGTYVNRALNEQGYIQVYEQKDADIGIYLSYSISDPEQVQKTETVLDYGQTGVSSSFTTGTVNSYGSTSSYTGYTTYQPTYGITGSHTETTTYITYTGTMILEAIDLNEFRKTKKFLPVWKTKAATSSGSDDLRKLFPYLVVASEKYMGTNTGEKVNVVVLGDDEKLLKIKGVEATSNSSDE